MKNKITNTRLSNDQIGIFYIGQAGFLFKYNNIYVLIDPYLSDYVDRYCSTEKIKWKRKYAPPVEPQELNFVDYVVCTHAHLDHMDPDTISKIYQNRTNSKMKFITPAPALNDLLNIGVNEDDIIKAYADQTINIDGISVTALPAAHETINRDIYGNCIELGFIFRFGDKTVYHSGDSCVYEGLKDSIKNIDVAILPINGRDSYRLSNSILGNMNIYEAADLAYASNIKLLIPMHFDLYDINGADPVLFTNYIDSKYPSLRYMVMKPKDNLIII